MIDNREQPRWQKLAPFARHLGVRFLEAPAGSAAAVLALTPELANRKGDMHGGAMASLLDLTAGQALRGSSTEIKGVATVSMTTNYLETAAGEITARAQVIKAGRTIGWVDARAETAAGVVVATASCTFRIIR
ncbi:MAG TPA: PaaI family thioesterase [Devosia sp.]|nr:PaaI family thioesterase [Devosia sp.]